MPHLEKLADSFFDVFYSKNWIGECALLHNLSINESYQVQDLVYSRRIELGEAFFGFKVGCTSRAIRAQLNICEPIMGRLLTPHIHTENYLVRWRNYVNCAIEPEIVIVTGSDLFGLNLPDKVLIDAIEYVSPGVELHNYKFWCDPPCIQELICSGGIHAGLIIGDSKVSPHNLSFRNENFFVYKNGTLIASSSAGEIMGGPLNSLRWLVGNLAKRGESLKRGSIVIPGSPMPLIEINHNTDLRLVIDEIGSLVTKFIS